MAGSDSLSVPNLENISQHEEMVESIKGIAAFARNEQGEELILFQNFSRSHVIQPGNSLFLQNNTYETVQHKGFTLGGKLSAVYEVDQQRLLFHSFRTTNTFLPLAEFYEEASEQEIREVLDHNCLAPEDAEALAVGANQWFRKRFAMLRDSGILDNFTAKQIRKHSEGFEIDIQLKGNKIIFPSDKQEAKRLLQFLNEEIFRGAITETLYETNSKREAD
ncbi:Kiwa anti-phage protein KwaB-like domain-containing protein [Thiolapillus sp.]|uniref:Kiwa anti-phage protein KwaB-like domain-containing protein n=1 Tax=Thiolapillus sp. TaxID=2017437 RepID=UPI003AF96C7A